MQRSSINTGELLIDDVPAPAGVTFSIASAAANVCEITVQIVDAAGKDIDGIHALLVWLSDVATGLDVTEHTTSGTMTAKAASGEDLGALTAKKCFMGQTDADGSLIVEITDTNEEAFFVCVANPVTGRPMVSRVLVDADWGN